MSPGPRAGPGLDGAIELLERSLAYTRGALADVRPHLLGRPTPCTSWDLAGLLIHMEDSLDALTEAAAGYVAVVPVPAATGVAGLQQKACTLLGAWLAARPADGVRPGLGSGTVTVGDAALDPALLVATGALEITLHGWDVGRATGAGAAVPDELARGLLRVAHLVVDRSHRAPQFAPPRPVAADAPPAVRLLAWTGRMTEPPAPIREVPPAPDGLAS